MLGVPASPTATPAVGEMLALGVADREGVTLGEGEEEAVLLMLSVALPVREGEREEVWELLKEGEGEEETLLEPNPAVGVCFA